MSKVSNKKNKNSIEIEENESEDVNIKVNNLKTAENLEKTSFFKDEGLTNINNTDLNTNIKGPRWINKQRVLFVASRGIANKERIIMNNIMSLVPHSKKECKIEKNLAHKELNEICFNHSCSNCVYFEHKKREFVMWVFKSPEGPSIKFQISNVHTLDEPKLMGNSLKYSRPILNFDSSFDHDSNSAYLGLVKEMLSHVFNTPRYHPKSKPFYDHVISFNNVNNSIFFRNYQILNELKETFKSDDDTSKLQLVEIGPRFSLKIVKIFEGVMGGKCLYSNPLYISPTELVKKNAMKFKERLIKKMKNDNELEEKQKKKVDVNTRWMEE